MKFLEFSPAQQKSHAYFCENTKKAQIVAFI